MDDACDGTSRLCAALCNSSLKVQQAVCDANEPWNANVAFVILPAVRSFVLRFDACGVAFIDY
jgi:hypothetical protein